MYDIESEKNMFAKRFTQIVDEKRRESNNGLRITESTIAAELGVTRKMIYNYKKGENLPTFDVIVRIIDFFGISLEWLIGRSDEKFPGQTEIQEVYGLSHAAVVNMHNVNSCRPPLGDDRISFDPPIYGSTENGPPTFAWISNPWRLQTLYSGCDSDVDKLRVFCSLEMQTLNMILEDWSLITACTKFIYSVPKLRIVKYNPNYHLFEIHRILNKIQHSVSMKSYQNIINSGCAVATIDEAYLKLDDSYDNMLV